MPRITTDIRVLHIHFCSKSSIEDILSPTPTPTPTPSPSPIDALGSTSDVFESSEQLTDSGSDSCGSYFSEDEQETSPRDLSRKKTKSKKTRWSTNQPQVSIAYTDRAYTHRAHTYRAHTYRVYTYRARTDRASCPGPHGSPLPHADLCRAMRTRSGDCTAS